MIDYGRYDNDAKLYGKQYADSKMFAGDYTFHPPPTPPSPLGEMLSGAVGKLIAILVGPVLIIEGIQTLHHQYGVSIANCLLTVVVCFLLFKFRRLIKYGVLLMLALLGSFQMCFAPKRKPVDMRHRTVNARPLPTIKLRPSKRHRYTTRTAA